jgi:mannose-6-phosphate isomerase-like protein (cupin superfamily)
MKSHFTQINKPFKKLFLKSILTLFTIGLMTFSYAQDIRDLRTTQEILESFAYDYLHDAHFTRDWNFGVLVDQEKWSVAAKAKTDKMPAQIKVLKGFPENPSFYFTSTRWALEDIAAGKINALTGSVKAFSTDYAPFDLEVMEGYQPDENFVAEVLPLLFHFWTKGTPEVIPFGPNHTRNTHGAQASIFYYQPGFRSGYGIIYPGQHANENPKSQTNEFPTLIIFIKGKVMGRLDGKEKEVLSGNALFIPACMKHEFYNPYEEPAEFILLMFGEGA